MRISDWSSDVCSSDLVLRHAGGDLLRPLPDTAVLRNHPQHYPPPAPVATRRGGAAVGSPGVGYPIAVTRGLAPRVHSAVPRSTDAPRVGTAGVSTCKSRWSPSH